MYRIGQVGRMRLWELGSVSRADEPLTALSAG